MLNVVADSDPSFAVPALSPVQVPRANVLSLIARANGTLTILSAPAGFGKSTAMAQAFELFSGKGMTTAWLTLRATDNDPPTFLSRLEKLLKHLGIAELDCDATTCIAKNNAPFALFLDDLENIHESSVLELIYEIAHRLPQQAYLIAATRLKTTVGLSRLRVSGRLTEVGINELRFDFDESKAIFNAQLSIGSIPPQQLEHLYKKTEGWAAALWLASIALKRTASRIDFISQYSGSTGTVAQYLSEVVLADQPAALRRLLLRLSVVRSFNAALCTALNEGVDSQEMIEHLDSQGLVMAVESEPGHWRFHGLFAEFLREQLNADLPGQRDSLHLAASRWFESQTQVVLAIDHAVLGRAFNHAIRLLEDHSESLLEQGRLRQLRRWFIAIPEDLLAAHPMLCMISIWATALTEGAHLAHEQLNRIDWRNSPDPKVRNHGAALYPTLLGMQDHCEQALSAGQLALERMEPGYNFASATLLNAIAHQTLIIGDARDAQRMLDAARRLHGGESPFNRMYSETTEGLIDLLHGRLRHASARFRLAVDASRATSNKHTHGNAWAGVLYTATAYEANELVKTKHLLNVYLPLAREVSIPDHLVIIYLLKARSAVIERDLDTALQALTDLEYLGHSRKLPRAVAAAQLERAKILLMQGRKEASRDELARADDPAIWARECRQRLLAHDSHYLRMARLRWEIHFGDPQAAMKQLNDDLADAYSSGRRQRALVLQLLRALALHRCDHTLSAYKELENALEFAASEGYVRTVLDEGPLLAQVIVEFKAAYESRRSCNPLLSDYLRGLLVEFGPTSLAEPVHAHTSPLAEPLTRKEIVVLTLLTEGCSNLDLADRLHVSNSTVRTHLRNINAKLETSSRNQALAVARRLGLVP
ncbi:helix-turn-helix transcriptional regulator [Pseudomonas sp. BN505]|uniref:LuxR C-terminal-related transcriptional regulator n=1 Tax=unclassified Pseudomonas TaxID=196821 RepID=UPI002458EF09|nr:MULTISPECIES: LuxR C-terminal-related transcriptional regulator [unclassified Pseudomonas]MDH4842286.1 helix-turn-helix transcriptional regulator [Pseudomonas sp. BN605]MDH4855141.1 helix-turn-helix transcriptional regulator [Pseudomonas sp. BN505]